MSETGGSIAYECSHQSGGVHILEDHYLQEVIHPESGEPVGYGEKGELVLTSFGRASMPLIRYRTGDLVERVESHFCSCGRTFDLYKGGILGRADDMKLIRGVNVYPSGVENIVRDFAGVEEFQIIFFKEKGIDQVKVSVEPRSEVAQDSYREIERAVSEQLKRAHRLSFIVEVVAPGTLPRFELKAKRIQDLRQTG
ncbi:MAG: phenylacetate--CoA ligase family protein [Desulfitobacteriaceae bacterium]